MQKNPYNCTRKHPKGTGIRRLARIEPTNGVPSFFDWRRKNLRRSANIAEIAPSVLNIYYITNH